MAVPGRAAGQETGAALPPASDSGPGVPLDPAELIERQLEAIERENWAGRVTELNKELDGLVPSLNLRDVLKSIRNEDGGLDLGAFAGGSVRFLAREFLSQLGLLGRLMLLAVLISLLQLLRASFEGEAIGRLSSWVCYLVLFLVALRSFQEAAGIARGAVDTMSSFMLATLPLMSALLAAVGGIGSAGLLHPLMVGAVNIVAQGIAQIVIPLIFLSGVVAVAGTLSEKIRLNGIAGLLQTAALTILGLGYCVFLGVIAVRGLGSAVVDGVAIRGAKFLSASFIPVVGKMYAEALDVVAGGTLILKNAVTITGAAGILLLALGPALKIASLSLVY
ncbi:MAG: stage III sporulation protein AE, partial [Firmicutes bacterium]|nr:stage III sporulation protein AE [Bacillota bacterium]